VAVPTDGQLLQNDRRRLPAGDFAEPPPDVEYPPQHYAFLVSEEEFDEIYARILEQKIEHWADPRQSAHGINRNDGGRGTYFLDPAGHFMEIITRPYGWRS